MKCCNDYHMEPNPKTNPFPHTEYTTCRPNSTKPEILWDDLVNFLANEYLDPLSFKWAFRGVPRASYTFQSRLERELKRSKAWREKLKRELQRSEEWTEKLKRIDRQTAEDYLLSQFKKAAHHFTPIFAERI